MSTTQDQYKEAPARISAHLIRRGQAGLGHNNKALARQKLKVASQWESTGHDSHYLQFFPGMLATSNVALSWMLLTMS